MEKVNDNVFSSKLLGDGVAIAPLSNTIYSPCDGKLTTLFSTEHAFGITRNDEVEILIHIGIDTLTLQGKGFKILKKQGQFVKKGEKIVEAGFKYFSSSKFDSTIMLILTELKD